MLGAPHLFLPLRRSRRPVCSFLCLPACLSACSSSAMARVAWARVRPTWLSVCTCVQQLDSVAQVMGWQEGLRQRRRRAATAGALNAANQPQQAPFARGTGQVRRSPLEPTCGTRGCTTWPSKRCRCRALAAPSSSSSSSRATHRSTHAAAGLAWLGLGLGSGLGLGLGLWLGLGLDQQGSPATQRSPPAVSSGRRGSSCAQRSQCRRAVRRACTHRRRRPRSARRWLLGRSAMWMRARTSHRSPPGLPTVLLTARLESLHRPVQPPHRHRTAAGRRRHRGRPRRLVPFTAPAGARVRQLGAQMEARCAPKEGAHGKGK